MYVYSQWVKGSGSTPFDCDRPALADAYPGLGALRADGASVYSTGRVCLGVPNPPVALLADYRFPPVRAGDDPLSFAGYQNALLDAVGLYLAAKLAAGFAFNGVTYPLDSDSRLQWLGLLTLGASLTYPLHVTSADGLTVTSMDQLTASNCAKAAQGTYLTATQTAASYRAAITGATTAAALDAIVLT